MTAEYLQKILKNYTTENGEILKGKIKELVLKFDKDLLDLLYKNEQTREYFFDKFQNFVVFNYKKFIDFIDDKNFYLDSYTKFSNKIALSLGEKHIANSQNVVLDFAFKDCILAGGASKDDEKSKEIFYNETLAGDEINRLLKKKALVNFKLYKAEQNRTEQNRTEQNRTEQNRTEQNRTEQNRTEQNRTEIVAESLLKFSRDKAKNVARDLPADTITDNLIIKGNNLIALHSLKSNFAGRVKLIYIDPPYNTGSDSFNYNDSFNHSTWLTFMKNRLEIAREFLRDDGVIFVQCDDNEQGYLKVLMDEIFGRDNFVACFIWEKKGGRQNDAKFYSVNHEYILNFAKKKENFKPNLMQRTTEMLSMYKNPDNDPRGVWTSITLHAKDESSQGNYSITFDNGVTYQAPAGTHARLSYENMKKAYAENRLWFGENGKNTPRLKKFLSEIKEGVIHNTILTLNEVGNTQKAKQEIKALFRDKNSDIFTTPKPEALIKRIIEISTNENDIVLDFFLGSGTTAAVAHKMNRQYIGIEQMNYIETIAVERLKKVISGEQGGISKAVNWQGGGEFVYFELAKYNQAFIDKIAKMNDENAAKIYDEISQNGFLNFDIELKNLAENRAEFLNLSLDEKREFLISILNKNVLYLGFDDIDDENFKIKDDEKKLNREFYNE